MSAEPRSGAEAKTQPPKPKPQKGSKEVGRVRTATSQGKWAWILVAPSLFMLAIVIVYPIISAVIPSFQKDSGLDPATGLFVEGGPAGFSNYTHWILQQCNAVGGGKWLFIFAFEGIANKLFGTTILWTGSETPARSAIIIADVWKTTPFMALLILTGLQIIPGDVYEAAKVDGVTAWQRFIHITLPLVRPALMVARRSLVDHHLHHHLPGGFHLRAVPRG